jgi:biotin-(acetyl-CoA carboxylase) ligase/methylase of polypeptide subunit release factors
MKNKDSPSESLAQVDVDSTLINFKISEKHSFDLVIPKSVYPPREDTRLLSNALKRLDGKVGNAIEIGSGSGILSIQLANLGWKVKAYDVNPLASTATEYNVEKAGLAKHVDVEEGGLGDFELNLNSTDLLIWNLPYLSPPPSDEPHLEWIEEASMSDLPGNGWSGELIDYLEKHRSEINPNLLILLLFRTDPQSPSRPVDWAKSGWAVRLVNSAKLLDEKLGVYAFWKPGLNIAPHLIDSCISTMDEAKKLPEQGWQRIRAKHQTGGRGRRKSIWKSNDGDMIATWNISSEIFQIMAPGMIQTIVGSNIAEIIGCHIKWPNDLINKNGHKLGGILIETDSSSTNIRIGVGINKTLGEHNGEKTSGWYEFQPNLESERLFRQIDAVISSIFETSPLLPNVINIENIQLESWKGISKLMSRGVYTNTKNKNSRVVSINESGSLEFEMSGERILVSDLDSIKWKY